MCDKTLSSEEIHRLSVFAVLGAIQTANSLRVLEYLGEIDRTLFFRVFKKAKLFGRISELQCMNRRIDQIKQASLGSDDPSELSPLTKRS